ncbi:hypothetical protein [Algoriphagus alkaliphilus]|uniref:hypothetical protein n=1 Tax=Algoriphagus alkaliphilus TaxID=279824 RepID=UPI003899338E
MNSNFPDKVNENLQQHSGVVATGSVLRIKPGNRRKIDPVYHRIHRPGRMVNGNEIFQSGGRSIN